MKVRIPTIAAATDSVSPDPNRRRFYNDRDLRLGLLMMLPAILVLAFVMLYPAFVAFQSSFFRIDTLTRTETFVGLRNFQNLLSDPMFWGSFRRTMIWVFGAMSTQVVAGIAVAVVLNQAVKGRNLVRGFVLFPYLVPAIVAVLTWRWIFSDTVGVANYLLDDVLGLSDGPVPWFHPDWAMVSVVIMSLWKYLPYWGLLILARMQTIPTDLYEAAEIDGASGWQKFRYVTLPWILPVIIVLLILRSIWAFNEFDMVYLPAAGGPLFSTTTVPVYIRYLAFDVGNLGAAAAVAVTMLGMVVVLTLFYFAVYRRAERNLS